MRLGWTLVATGALTLGVGCGGRSVRTGDDTAASGGVGASGTSGTSGGAAVGGKGAGAGGIGRDGFSPACRNPVDTSEALARCETYLTGECPTDLDDALLFIESGEDLGPERFAWVQQGCGMIQLGVTDNYMVHWFVFDDQGTLVGYAYNDDVAAVCAGTFAHECPSARPCPLSPDALETGALCACPCPRAAPPLGLQFAEPACVYSPFGYVPCRAKLEVLLEQVASTGVTLRTGCGKRTVTLVAWPGWAYDCTYDENSDWIGTSHPDAEGERGCAGVDRWFTGAAPEECADESTCWTGHTDPPDGLQRCDPPP